MCSTTEVITSLVLCQILTLGPVLKQQTLLIMHLIPFRLKFILAQHVAADNYLSVLEPLYAALKKKTIN